MKNIVIFTILILNQYLFAGLNYDESQLEQKKDEIKTMQEEFKGYIKSEELKLEEKEKALKILQDEISQEKSELDILIKKNQELIDAIDGKIVDKGAKIYNKVKAKVAASIFDQMMLEGEIDKVFLILIKLKPNHVAKILKYMNITNSTILSELMIKKEKDECKKDNLN